MTIKRRLILVSILVLAVFSGTKAILPGGQPIDALARTYLTIKHGAGGYCELQTRLPLIRDPVYTEEGAYFDSFPFDGGLEESVRIRLFPTEGVRRIYIDGVRKWGTEFWVNMRTNHTMEVTFVLARPFRNAGFETGDLRGWTDLRQS